MASATCQGLNGHVWLVAIILDEGTFPPLQSSTGWHLPRKGYS